MYVISDRRFHLGRYVGCHVGDAMIVRRAVTLGLPVFLVGTEGNEEDSVANDYLKLATEIIENAPPA